MRRTMIGALAVLALTKLGPAQETVNGGMVVLGPLRSNGSTATVDFTGAGSTAPVKAGTLAARPGTCQVGQMYFSTDAAAGQNLAYCTSSGSWSILAGGAATGVNTQSGTSYTLQDGDCGKLVTFNNGSAVWVTLPRAGLSSWFVAGWVVDVQNRGAGSVTITPVTSAIDGGASLTLPPNAGVRIVSDGANYFTERGMGGAAGAGASPFSALHSGGVTYANPLPCFKVASISYTELSAAATSQQIDLATITEPWAPASLQVEETVPFTSGSSTVTALGVSVGGSSTPDYYMPRAALMNSPGTINTATPVGGSLAAGGSHSIFLKVTVTNLNPGNLGNGIATNLTAGALTVRACGVALQ